LKLTPIDIKKQEFKKSLRGFDPIEVETYLEYVAEEYEKLLQINQQLEKQVATYQAELKHYKDVEKTLKQTLYEVQETSMLSKKTSKKEAELIKREAEIRATKIIEEARAEVEKLKKELSDLKHQKDSFVTRLRYLLSSQLDLLEMLDTDDADLDKLREKTKKTFTGSRRSSVQPQKNNKIENTKKTPEETEPEINLAPAKPKKQPAPQKKEPEKSTKRQDFFKDIFGDDLDVDDIFK